MYIYILCWLPVILTTIAISLKGNSSVSLRNQQIYLYSAIFPSVALVLLKGNVGSDTGVYLDIVERIANSSVSFSDIEVEIGFFFLVKSILIIISDERLIVNIISALIAIYLIYTFSKTKISILVFMSLVFSIFYFDMTMNGLRYGLAFILAKNSSDEFDQKNKKIAVVLAATAISIQISSFMLLILLRMRFFTKTDLIILIGFISGFFYLLSDKLLFKYLMYAESNAPDGYSGLLPLLISLTLISSIYFITGKIAKYPIILLVFELLSFYLTSFTYAGLRFQLLVLFSIFCWLTTLEFSSTLAIKKIAFVFIIIGIVGFVGKMRNFESEKTDSGSPFIPYHFIWDLK